MMRFLIWGFGETAVACSRELRAAGHTVAGVARSERLAAEAALLGVELLTGDLLAPDEITGLAGRTFDTVFVTAAGKMSDPERDPWRLYVEGARALADFHAAASSPPARIVVFSTTGVYGPDSIGPDGTIDEESPSDPKPKRMHGDPHAAATLNYTAAMEEVWRASGLPAILLRVPGIHKGSDEGLLRMLRHPDYRPPARDRTYQTINLAALARVARTVGERGEPGAIYNATPPRVRSIVATARAAAERHGLHFAWPPEADLAGHALIRARALESLGVLLTAADG